MNNRDFGLYQDRAVERFESILNNSRDFDYDEQALPAYTNPNYLMRWLFWERIRWTMKYLDKNRPYGTVLDFGCGLGVMFPYLQQISANILALDISYSCSRYQYRKTRDLKQTGRLEKYFLFYRYRYIARYVL
jgi:2-polyprenyl-3-methyl-5-hydroxy-6-metoxy-1,4-benzoquinol methylase